MSQQYALEDKRASCILGIIRHSITNCGKVERIVQLYSALVHPHLKYCVQFQLSECKKYIKILECVQRMTAKMMKGLEGITSAEWLSIVGLFSFEEAEG